MIHWSSWDKSVGTECYQHQIICPDLSVPEETRNRFPFPVRQSHHSKQYYRSPALSTLFPSG